MRHKLTARAEALSRQIYASLPWGYRVARLVVALTSDNSAAWGKFFYALFIQAGVEGMPDIKGPLKDIEPEKLEQMKIDRIIAKLPNGYGHQFGSSLWNIMYARWGKKNLSPSDVEDAIQLAIANIIRKRVTPDKGSSLKRTQSWALKIVNNLLITQFRSRSRRDEQSMVNQEGETIDINDPRSFSMLDSKLPPWQLKRLMAELRNVDPKQPERGPTWVRMVLENGQEPPKNDLAEEWGISPQGAGQWVSKNKDAIKKIIWKHLSDAA